MTVSDGSPRPDSVALSAATLRVPTVFRPYTNGASVLTVPTGTLDDVMSDVFDRFPALFARLVVNGVVPKFIGIYVNGQEHRTIGGFAAPVEPGAEVAIIPAVSGGSNAAPDSVAPSAVEKEDQMQESEAIQRYEDAIASGLSDYEAREEGWPTAEATPSAVEVLAQRFHEAYERLAPDFGYKTREASAVPWADVPDDNKRLMIATVEAVLADLTVALKAAGWRKVRARLPFDGSTDLSTWLCCSASHEVWVPPSGVSDVQ